MGLASPGAGSASHGMPGSDKKGGSDGQRLPAALHQPGMLHHCEGKSDTDFILSVDYIPSQLFILYFLSSVPLFKTQSKEFCYFVIKVNSLWVRLHG